MILVRKAARAKRWKTLLCYSTFEAKAKIKIDQRCNFISVLNSSVHVSTDEWYKKIYQLPLSFHFWLKANTKACGNKSCESTNPQISIWVKWSALRQLAIETGENWIESFNRWRSSILQDCPCLIRNQVNLCFFSTILISHLSLFFVDLYTVSRSNHYLIYKNISRGQISFENISSKFLVLKKSVKRHFFLKISPIVIY